MAKQIADLEARIASYTALIDEAIAEGDEESASELLLAVERACAKIDALRA